MSILVAEHIKKYYGEGETLVKALDDVSLSVERGEFVSIIGTSGSGKSTLLHMLGGLDNPTEGKVEFTANGGTETTPKLVLTIVEDEENGKKCL